MTKKEKVIKGLECCAVLNCGYECPYAPINECNKRMMKDAVELLNDGGRKWISVKDRLPKATQPDAKGNITFSNYVLTCLVYEDGHIWLTVDTCRVDRGVWLHEVPGEGCKVTHWMPLPEPPKGDEQCD